MKERGQGKEDNVLVSVPRWSAVVQREREAEKERIQQKQWITIQNVPDRECVGNKVMEQKMGKMKSINQSIETRKRE